MSTMLEASRTLAGVSAVLLAIAIAMGISPLGRKQYKRLDGRAAAEVGYLQIAALLLLAAVGLSASAAVLALAEFAT